MKFGLETLSVGDVKYDLKLLPGILLLGIFAAKSGPIVPKKLLNPSAINLGFEVGVPSISKILLNLFFAFVLPATSPINCHVVFKSFLAASNEPRK